MREIGGVSFGLDYCYSDFGIFEGILLNIYDLQPNAKSDNWDVCFDEKNGWIPEPELLGIVLGEEVDHTLRNIERLPGNSIIVKRL